VAGILIDIFQAVSNTFDLDEQWAEVMTALGKSRTMSQAIAFAVWGLVVGILVVWLYAAMRPRLGAGPKTALCAGLLIWVTVYALGSATPVFLHLIPVDLTAKALAAGLVETMVAGLAGAYFYKEQSTAEGIKASAARV
jgi:hypothetical protein